MVLDTSALIALLRGNLAVTSAVRDSEAKGEPVAFSSVSLFELLQSVYHRKQLQQERKIRAMAAQSLVLPLDVGAVEESAKIMGSLLRVGKPVNAVGCPDSRNGLIERGECCDNVGQRFP